MSIFFGINTIFPKDIDTAEVKKAVLDVLQTSYNDRLTGKQMKALVQAIDQDFLKGKRLKQFNFQISLAEYRSPFLIFRIIDNTLSSGTLRRYGDDESHYQVAVKHQNGKIEAVSAYVPIYGEGNETVFATLNQYFLTDLNEDGQIDITLLYHDFVNGLLQTVRTIVPKNGKIYDSTLSIPLVPAAGPKEPITEKCPGNQFIGRNLAGLKIRECSSFILNRETKYWDCPKPDIEEFSFDCKDLKIKPRKLIAP